MLFFFFRPDIRLSEKKHHLFLVPYMKRKLERSTANEKLLKVERLRTVIINLEKQLFIYLIKFDWIWLENLRQRAIVSIPRGTDAIG